MPRQFLGRETTTHFLQLIASIVLLSATPASFLFAASTGVTVSPAELTASAGERVKFVASTIFEETVTSGTFIRLQDGGAGSFYNGSISGACNPNALPVVAQRFAIEKNKAVCYSNSVPGTHVVSIRLEDSTGMVIGEPATVSVTVLASTTVPVSTEADVQVVKTVDNPAPTEGDLVVYTVRVTNTGPEIATGVTVKDILPPGLAFVSADPVPAIADLLLGWNISALSVGESWSAAVAARVATGTLSETIQNTATAESETVDPDKTNNTALVTISPQAPVPLQDDTYRLEGYVWHDSNRDGVRNGWSKTGEEEGSEVGLSGWRVTAQSGTTTYSALTDETGYYALMVVAGTWVITEEVRPGWERTTAESYEVTVPEPVREDVALDVRQRFAAFLIPTAYAEVPGSYGYYNFGNVEVVVPVVQAVSHSNGSSATRVKRSAVVAELPVPKPTPLISSQQVTVVPVGAPATGAGGAAPLGNQLVVQQLLAVPLRRFTWYEI